MKPLLFPILPVTVACCRETPILPEEAKDRIGENANVRGLVEQVSLSQKGHAFLNFGGRYAKHVFTGFILWDWALWRAGAAWFQTKCF